jgi:hypothetical protein
MEIARLSSGCMKNRQIAAKVRRYFQENRDKKGEKTYFLAFECKLVYTELIKSKKLQRAFKAYLICPQEL